MYSTKHICGKQIQPLIFLYKEFLYSACTVYIYIYTCMHANAYRHIHIQIRTQIHIYNHIKIYISICTYANIRTFTYIYICRKTSRTHKHAYMHTCIHRYVHCIALYCIAWHTNVNSAMQFPAIQRNRYIHSSVRISDVTIASPSIRICQGNFLRWPYLRLLNHYKSARYCNIHYEYLCYILSERTVASGEFQSFDGLWCNLDRCPGVADWVPSRVETNMKKWVVDSKVAIELGKRYRKNDGNHLAGLPSCFIGSEVVSHWIVSDRDMGGTPFSNPQLWPINMWLHKVYIPQISIHGHISVLLPRNSIYKII